MNTSEMMTDGDQANGIHQVPIVDISPFTTSNGSLVAQRLAAQDLAKKVQINGCVGVTSHGISPELLAEAFQVTSKLFNLPYEEKMKAPHPDAPTPHRGYSGTGRERAAAKTELEDRNDAKREDYAQFTDYKESYEIGSDENKVDYNIWLPDEVFPGFRAFTTKLYWELNKTAQFILDALILSLELTKEEAESVRALHSAHNNQLRLLHYPPIEEGRMKDRYASRLGAHTDWRYDANPFYSMAPSSTANGLGSAFTLLFQDAHGGLQFLDRASGDFIDAIPKEGVLYMNIGDMFQRISNGRSSPYRDGEYYDDSCPTGAYPSALHRVVVKNPEAARYSIPYFVSPSSDGIIQPQASRVAKDGKQIYEPVTFMEYSEQMFQRTNVYG